MSYGMKGVSLLIALFVFFVPALTHADSPHTSTASYLKELEEQGYCVIPEVLSSSEAETLYQRVWHEYIEKAWPKCKMDDRSNWAEVFPKHDRYGIFTGTAGQIQVLWDLRQDPRIVDIFAQIWNTKELIVSMDGLSLMCPPEIREGCFDAWPHVDQGSFQTSNNAIYNNNPPVGFVSESALTTKPFTIQGQFLFEDSCDGDGGFYCIPRSHLRFTEFAPQLEAINAMQIPQAEKKQRRQAFIQDFFGKSADASGMPYCMKHITAPRGSLILWDSRTIHWNQHALKDRVQNKAPRVRMVGYLCYVPKARLTNEVRALRKLAFETGASTTHNPANPLLKHTKDHIYEEFRQYLEDQSYTQPKIALSPLGESLLGF